jgi:hypothetical protein
VSTSLNLKRPERTCGIQTQCTIKTLGGTKK